eukprot:1195921-Prorocentrum_minimum.AAC.2
MLLLPTRAAHGQPGLLGKDSAHSRRLSPLITGRWGERVTDPAATRSSRCPPSRPWDIVAGLTPLILPVPRRSNGCRRCSASTSSGSSTPPPGRPPARSPPPP